MRLRVLEDAGRLAVPFTTGILVGIGETCRSGPSRSSRSGRSRGEYGAVQEVIVQNFRAKPDTAMRNDATTSAWRSTSPRSPSPGWCSGPKARVQAPPNLVDLPSAGGCSPPASTTGAASRR